MFFESCKLMLKSRHEHINFTNHFSDVFKASTGTVGLKHDRYPLYLMIDDNMNVEHTYTKEEFDKRKNKRVSLDTFLHMKYIVSYHFRTRFRERFEDSSDTRFKKLVRDMLKKGTWMKRKDSIQLIKYKKTSSYVLYSRFEKSDKVHYLIVLTDENILTTIYEFDIKDLKFFKET